MKFLKENPIFNEISTIIKTVTMLLRLIGVFGILLNIYVILCLFTTEKYIIKIPHLALNGNICLGIALIILLIMCSFVLPYSSIILSIIANVALVSTGKFVLKSFIESSDHTGLVTQNAFFSVFYNYSRREKLEWIPELEKEFARTLNNFAKDAILDRMNCYNDLKDYVARSIAEEKAKLALALENKSPGMLSNIGHWIFDHKIVILVSLGVVSAVAYTWFNGYITSGVFKTLKETGKVLENTGNEISALARQGQNTNMRLIEVAEQLKNTNIRIDDLTTNCIAIDNKLALNTETITEHQNHLNNIIKVVNEIRNANHNITATIDAADTVATSQISEQVYAVTRKCDFLSKWLEESHADTVRKIAAMQANQTNFATSMTAIDTQLRNVFTQHARRLEHLETKYDLAEEGAKFITNNIL